MTGKSVTYSGISQGNEGTESKYEDEVGKKFRELEFGAKIKKAANTRVQGFEDMVIEKGDEVFYETPNKKAWLVQVKGQLVGKGFQEGEKPKSDSLTLLWESLKKYFAIAANKGFRIRRVDIGAVFLQAR